MNLPNGDSPAFLKELSITNLVDRQGPFNF